MGVSSYEVVIIGGRFVPAGRSAATLSSGVVELRWRRFAVADGVAGVAWACYASMLGYLGGRAWQDSFWKPFVVGLGVATVVGGAGELWRRYQRGRGKDVLGKDLDGAGRFEDSADAGEREAEEAAQR